MKKATRNALLILVVALVIAAIGFLEGRKVRVQGASVAVGDGIEISTQQRPHTPDFEELKKHYPVARELVSPDGYINTQGQPITIQSFIGKKIILLDFWTYSCINCERTIPYLNAWYEKYKDQGLEIIGVHSPEFAFEKKRTNVEAAVERFGIKYPVVLDSSMLTWSAYNNRYWPQHYLIDINGLVVDRHIGEGSYEETEAKIQGLLRQRAHVLGINVAIATGTVEAQKSIASSISSETYFGSYRNEYLANGTRSIAGLQQFVRPDDRAVERSQLYLAGSWNIQGEYAQNQSPGARIIYKYTAKNVYIVASSQEGSAITVLRDGEVVKDQKGVDVDDSGTLTIKDARLYKLIAEEEVGTHTLEIIIKDPGLEVYTFTFG